MILNRPILLRAAALGQAILCLCLPLRASDLPAESHPSILYDAASVDLIRDRIDREPYSIWWQGIQSLANQGLTMSFTGAAELTKARYGKYLAFAYGMTDSLPYAQKCLEVLQLINPSGNWGAELHNQAEPMMCYCEAYDMLKGSGFNLGSSEIQIRANLATKAQEFRDNLLILLYANNWRVRYLSALGIAAMTLADLPEAESWHDWAESMVMLVFDSSQVVGEGAWAEGPDYLLYSADIYLPYMLAFHRLITGADLINEPSVHLTHDWSWKIRLPNGQRPNFEDSHLTYFYGDLLATVYGDAAGHQWDYETVGDPSNFLANDHWRVDAICYYDDEITGAAPEIAATIFLPEGGHAVFRSGWGWDDVYFFLVGEHGPARTMGLGHDHADATSFILYAYGEMLALDAGYISWDFRTAVNKARNHSMILVDGSGPPSPTQFSAGDADAYLKDFYDIGDLQFCDDSTFYQNASIRRSALFADRGVVILRDRLISSNWRIYDWRLHGNGGGTSGGSFQITSDGAIWGRNGASLKALIQAANSYSYATEPLLLSATVDTHSFAYNQILTHQTLNARIVGSQASLLSALCPYPAGDPPPVMQRLATTSGAAIRIGSRLAWTSPQPNAGEFSGQFDGFGAVRVSGDWFYLAEEDENAALLHLVSCRLFAYRDTLLFSAGQPVTLALDRRGTIWKGHLTAAGNYAVAIYCGQAEPMAILFNGSAVPFTYANQYLSVNLQGSGYLDIEFAPAFSKTLQETAARKSGWEFQASPFDGGVDVRFELTQPGAVRITVCDLLGRIIADSERNYPNSGEFRQRLDSRAWTNGIYFVRMDAEGKMAVQKVVVVR